MPGVDFEFRGNSYYYYYYDDDDNNNNNYYYYYHHHDDDDYCYWSEEALSTEHTVAHLLCLHRGLAFLTPPIYFCHCEDPRPTASIACYRDIAVSGLQPSFLSAKYGSLSSQSD